MTHMPERERWPKCFQRVDIGSCLCVHNTFTVSARNEIILKTIRWDVHYLLRQEHGRPTYVYTLDSESSLSDLKAYYCPAVTATLTYYKNNTGVGGYQQPTPEWNHSVCLWKGNWLAYYPYTNII